MKLLSAVVSLQERQAERMMINWADTNIDRSAVAVNGAAPPGAAASSNWLLWTGENVWDKEIFQEKNHYT